MAQVNAHGKVQFHLKEGAEHKALGVKEGDKIPVSKLEHAKAAAAKSGDVTAERRAVFALNARHFHHSHKGSQAGH